MLNSDGSRLLTASDLLNFLGCHHSIFLDLMGARDPESPDKEDAQAQLINDKGNELESAHLDRLRKEGRKIVEVPPRLPLADRHALTLDAMRSGAEIVHGGVLCGAWRTHLRTGPHHARAYGIGAARIATPSLFRPARACPGMPATRDGRGPR